MTAPAVDNDCAVPAAARNLGYAGLAPFIATTLGCWWLDGEARVASEAMLLSYAAVILSFMGAVHWGLALRPREASGAASPARLMTISVLPALVAWAALAMRPATALWVLAAAFAALGSIDRRYAANGTAPRWYWRLRLPLTAVVVVCLLLALAENHLRAA